MFVRTKSLARTVVADLRRRPRLAGAVSAVTVAAIVLACYQAFASPTSNTRLSAFTVAVPTAATVTFQADGAAILSDGSMSLPLDAYDAYAADPANEKLVYDAATTIEQTCMRSRGLTLPTGWGGMFLPTPPPPLVFYGVATMSDAQQYGYRLPEPPSPQTQQQAATPQAVTNAFNGTPGHPGCAQQASDLLDIAQANAADDALLAFRSQAQDGVNADARLAAATAAWASCMSQAGYHYSDPLGPEHDRALLAGSASSTKDDALPSPSSAEKRMAETDVTCKNKTNYLQTYAVLSAAYQHRIIEQNTGPLQHVLAEWATVLRLARSY